MSVERLLVVGPEFHRSDLVTTMGFGSACGRSAVASSGVTGGAGVCVPIIVRCSIHPILTLCLSYASVQAFDWPLVYVRGTMATPVIQSP